jgi:hypothetical protein
MGCGSKVACVLGCAIGFGVLMETARNFDAPFLKVLFSFMGGLLFMGMLALLNDRPWNIRRASAVALLLAGSLIFGVCWTYGGLLATWAMRALARAATMAFAMGLIIKAPPSMRGADS